MLEHAWLIINNKVTFVFKSHNKESDNIYTYVAFYTEIIYLLKYQIP